MQDEKKIVPKKKRPKGSAQLRALRKKKKRKKQIRRTIIAVCIVCAILLLLLISAILGIRYLIHRYRSAMGKEENISTLAPDDTVPIDEGITIEPVETYTDSPDDDISSYLAQIDAWIKGTTQAYEDPTNSVGDITEAPTEPEKPTTSPEYNNNDIINIMLIGMDARGGLNGRADTMIILTINKKTEQISMTSLLRDMYVALPVAANGVERKPNRLNTAYTYGGSPLVLDTVELNFGLHIDYYITVDFLSFILGIDAVGGIDLEVTEKEVYWINEYLNEINGLYGREANVDKYPEGTSGLVHMDGAQALAYARIRYVGSDFARTQRQRAVITAAVGKLKGMSLAQIDDTLMRVLPLITSNIPENLIFSLVLSAPSLIKYPINQYRIPKDKTWNNLVVDKAQVIGVDLEANRQYLHQIVYGE